MRHEKLDRPISRFALIQIIVGGQPAAHSGHHTHGSLAMRIHRTVLFGVLAVVSGAAVATAGHESGHGHAAGKKADMMACGKMHDGMMTPEEHRKHAGEMFQKLDADKDGTITRAEFDRHHEDMMKRHDHQSTAPGAAPRT